MIDKALLLGKSKSLVGIVTEPSKFAQDNGKPAMIFLNAGLIHRVGPNRLHVNLARRLAKRGCLSLRFDHSGIGDSPVRTDNLPFDKSSIAETQEVMDSVSLIYGSDRFCLLGLCSGAMTSFMTACQDSRVVAAVLLNARGIGGTGAWEQHAVSRWNLSDYMKKLFTPRGFLRAFTGRAPYVKLIQTVRNRFKQLSAPDGELEAVAASLGADINALIQRNVSLLWVCGDGDPSIEYLKLMARTGHEDLVSNELVSQVTVTGSNHTFDALPAQEQVMNAIEAWTARYWP